MRCVISMVVVAVLFVVSACGGDPGQSSSSSEEALMNKPSIDEASARNYELVDSVAMEFDGSIELISDVRTVCDSHSTAPGCPDGGTHTHLMHSYKLRITPVPSNFYEIVREKIQPHFPADQGWSMKRRTLGTGPEFHFWHEEGWAVSVAHGTGPDAGVGIFGWTPMLPVRPGDLDIDGHPEFTPTHTPPAGSGTDQG